MASGLYQDVGVLILDEATSALDSITEKLVMDAFNDLSGKDHSNGRTPTRNSSQV
ncbi:hypothetical protein ACQUQP_05480 [Marinobacterium sp. YM272]|uniref:hypothetical protein n=1 Tax=Marinobacterium sp. YM272 TaxID=3421654 RepID=UPI003D7F37AC